MSTLSSLWLSPKPEPKSLSILGSGHQALAHIQCLTKIYPSISSVNIWNHQESTAHKLAEGISGWLDGTEIKVHEKVEGNQMISY